MKRLLLVGLLLPVVMLAGCDTCDSSVTYFDGTVLAQYHQQKDDDSNDSFTITFYEPGSYHVAFSQTPGKDGLNNKMPADFDMTLKKTPRVHVISEYILPDFLRVTITHNGISESHDFE